MTPDEFLALLALVNQILAIVSGSEDDSATVAREPTRYRILNQVELNGAILSNETYGLSELYAYIQDTINAVQNVRLDTTEPHIATVTDVLAAIALLTPVTLPETPPPGYGGSLDASAVWLSNLETYDWCPVD